MALSHCALLVIVISAPMEAIRISHFASHSDQNLMMSIPKKYAPVFDEIVKQNLDEKTLTNAAEIIAGLASELNQLKRDLYLRDVRHMGCPAINAILGDGVTEDRFNFVQCYPQALKESYCMGGLNESLSRGGYCEQMMPAGFAVGPKPKGSLDNLMKVGPPYVRAQFPPYDEANSLYDTMKMTAMGGEMVWDKATFALLQKILTDPKGDVSPRHYPDAQKDMQEALRQVGGVRDKHVLIVGSISPWLEAIAHHAGAKTITTVDYNLPHIEPSAAPWLTAQEMPQLLKNTTAKFDVILSYSSLEHDGLGRYGDPLNPDGDLAAQKELFLLLAENGKYILGIPGSENDDTALNSQRYYGPIRFPMIAKGWMYNGAVTSGKSIACFTPGNQGAEAGEPSNHNVLILSKPNPNAMVLEDTYGVEGCTLTCEKTASSSMCCGQGLQCQIP